MKKKIVLLLFALASITANAQIDSNRELIDECQRLYSDGEYTTALAVMQGIDTEGLDNQTRQEVELLKALATVGTDASAGRALLFQYIADYPETAKKEFLGCHIAESYYYTGNYEEACEWFSNSDKERLTPEERERAKLHYALSMLECGKESAATNLLQNIELTGKKYVADATFHLAVTDYDNGKLDEAYKRLEKIEFNRKYYFEVPYYFAGIYLKEGDITRAETVANKFLADHAGTPRGTRMEQIKGAARFAQGDYNGAITHLTQYIANSTTPQRIAKYQLAMSLFETGKESDALELFNECSEGNDDIAQNSLLHAGIIQLKRGNTDNARMSFEQAARMTNDSKIREKAMYNYALCIHQTRYSPFAESVKVFEQFLNEYPNSAHADQVGSYLVEVYMNTRNYDVALESIEKIERPSGEILEAKQKILYRLGVQEFINGNMDGAVNFMNRSIELKEYNRDTYADALYWLAEAQYNKGEYNIATGNYSQAAAAGGENGNKALYGLGYALFQQKRYDEARATFNRFVSDAQDEEKETVADAYNRIADCYFYQRNYAAADRFYKEAVAYDANSGDYALYRSALTLGLSGNNSDKVSTLNKLISEYPTSIYAEQAYYEMGRAFIEQSKYNEAISTYDTFIERYPESPLARRVAAEKAMIYNTTGNSRKAIAAYKEVIENYPHSEEAQVAAQDLRTIYIELGEVDEFAQYVANTPTLPSIDSNEVDTLTYIAAERFYNRNEFDVAEKKFKEYLNEFPQGAFRLNCHYYLGAIYYGNGMSIPAIENLEKVIEFPDSKFCEEAIVLASDIYFTEQNYKVAEELYRQMIVKSNSEERRLTARIGVMRSAAAQGKYETAIEFAGTVIQSNGCTPEQRREALYNRAKAHIQSGNGSSAESDLEELSGDTRTKEGAEAKYLLAQIMFDNGNHSGCESEIMEFIEMSTPHSYWLARSFILLSDLYAAQGKTLEAKQYLQSLGNNYSGDDDIADMITERIEKLTSAN